MNVNIREIVLDTLLIWESEKKKSHLLIRNVLEKYDYLDARDKAFFKRVSEGTISYLITLDHVLDRLSKKPMGKCKPEIRNILRLSAYQILFMEKVPDNAVCDEAVKLCRRRSFEEFCPFVNGVLRNICKNKDKCLDFSTIEDRVKRLSVEYSCPEWIVKMFVKETDDAEALLASLQDIKPTCVKIINEEKKADILKAWSDNKIDYCESRFVKNAYLLSGIEGVSFLPGFLDGDILVQDESSMMAAMASGVRGQSNLFIVDTCAAPGGKSAFIAASASKDSRILSCDVSQKKVSLIEDNIKRMKLSNITAKVMDATEFNPDLFEKADVVIADVPCSGLGVMARKSDIKYNISNEMMKEICELQKRIVSNVSKYVKSGGVLIYSTCTIHKAENEKMVKYITENLPFEGDSLKPFVPALFERDRESETAVQMLPNVEGTDGFFVARFKKNR